MSKHQHQYIVERPRAFHNEATIKVLPRKTKVETYFNRPGEYPQSVLRYTRRELRQYTRSLGKAQVYSVEVVPCPDCGYTPRCLQPWME